MKQSGIFFFLLFGSMRLFGQVLFIDADSVAVVNPPLPPSASVSVHTALIRFTPEKEGARPANTKAKTIADAIGALSKEGKVNLLYLGTCHLDRQLNSTARFNSLEQRPSFSLDPNASLTVTNRQFGLELDVRAEWPNPGTVELTWNGHFSWSNELLDLWAGDKYLMFGMSVAKVLKPGLLFTEGGEDEEEPEQAGINLRALFRRKKEAKKEEPLSNSNRDVSYLDKDFRTLALTGRQQFRSGETAVFNYDGKSGGNTAERIFLIIEPEFEE